MFRRAVIPVVVLAATLCPIPVVGDAAPILTLALQPGDMPVAARSESRALTTDAEELGALAPYGVREGAYYWYSWSMDGASKTSSDSVSKGWVVSGNLYRASDEGGAKRLFALSRGAGGMTSSHLGDDTKMLDVPPYGDEQFARVRNARYLQESLVLVRKGTLVWEIVVKPSLGFEPTEAQIVEVLETYAAKQKARVGGR